MGQLEVVEYLLRVEDVDLFALYFDEAGLIHLHLRIVGCVVGLISVVGLVGVEGVGIRLRIHGWLC